MDYRLILIIVLVVVLVSLCLDCVFKEKFQAEIERITTPSTTDEGVEEVSPINTIDDLVNLYPIIEGEDTTSNGEDENSKRKHKNKTPQQTVGVTHILQDDYAKYDPIGYDGINNYTRTL